MLSLRKQINWTFVRQVGVFRWITRNGYLQFRKRILRQDSTLRLPHGNRVLLPRDSRMASVFITNANIDWGSEALLARYADRDRDFFDLGANIGYYAAYLSPLVRRSYAFEPDVRNYPGLRKNASLSPNIEIIEAAVSSRNGTAELFPGGNAAVSSLERIDGVRPVSVRVTTIDSFVAEHPGVNPCLVKIDIEDHDIEALRGMEKTVTEFQPLILTECKLNSELRSLCGRWKYEIYGFVRDRKTLKTCFRHFPPAGGAEEWTNMLFLVPQALNLDFASRAVGR